MRISDWSSDVCSSDLASDAAWRPLASPKPAASAPTMRTPGSLRKAWNRPIALLPPPTQAVIASGRRPCSASICARARSEEHTSELQSLMRISYAVFCLTKKKNKNIPQEEYLITNVVDNKNK